MSRHTTQQGGRPDPAALLGVTEVANRLSVKVNTVHIWRRRHPDFPKPLADLAGGPVWWAPDIDAWMKGRTDER